ncbi:MAG TPA: hypothetical protein VGS28_03680 [Candidatus Saccharimonadales bacterium]|nr:hypothetical protein [Candidatus Saccharimonadales bacterium]
MLLPTKKELRAFIRDRVALLVLGSVSLLTLVDILIITLDIHSNVLQVPVRYSEYSLNIQQGNWMTLYELALFTLICTIINAMLAIRIHKVRRAYAIGVLMLTVIICVIAFLVSRALIGLSATTT